MKKNEITTESEHERYYAEYDEFISQYDDQHTYCPECGGENISHTLKGIMLPDDHSKYRDTNRATCQCGWEGIVHDLTEEPKGYETWSI